MAVVLLVWGKGAQVDRSFGRTMISFSFPCKYAYLFTCMPACVMQACVPSYLLLLQTFIRIYQLNGLQYRTLSFMHNICSVSFIQLLYGIRLHYVIIRRVAIFLKMALHTMLVGNIMGVFVAGTA
jgi:hypothetical protein